MHKNANMRTSFDLPDELYRHLKARAALEGTSMRDLVVELMERALDAPAAPAPPRKLQRLPSIKLGAPMALKPHQFTNAYLSKFLYE